jgi:DNA-binding beta-propeller fold protein YncE
VSVRPIRLLLCLAGAALILAAVAGTASAAPPPLGGMTPLGCIKHAASATSCDQSVASMIGPSQIAMSPDGSSVYVVAGSSNRVNAFRRDPAGGGLTPIGCAGNTVASGCAAIAPLDSPYYVAISPDGRSLYVTTGNSQTVTILSRASDGTLGAAGCVKDDASTATCTQTVSELDFPYGVAVSRDNASVYVTSPYQDAVIDFDRAADGGLTRAGCIADTSVATCGTNTADGLHGPKGIAVSADGRNVYVADPPPAGNAVAVLSRASNGDLSAPPGNCVKLTGTVQSCNQEARGLGRAEEIAISPDDANLYVTGTDSQALVMFARNGSTGALTPLGCVKSGASAETCDTTATELGVPFSPVVSPDGLSTYVVGGDVIVALDRGSGGALTPSSCAKPSSSSASCVTTYTDTSTPQDEVVSPDNRFLYLVTGETLWVFARELPPACANGSATTPFEMPLSAPLSCTDPNGDPITRSIVTPPAHGDLGPIDQNAGAVPYTPRARFSGSDRFTFQASDGTLASPPSAFSVGVRPAPAVSGLTLSHRRFRVGRKHTPVSAARRRAPVGTTFRYRLSTAAAVTLAIDRLRPGRRVGGRCTKPTRANRAKRRCTLKAPSGKLRRAGRGGRNRTPFSGRIGARALRPGKYRVTVVATAAGRSSAPRHANFTVVRR